MDQDDLQGVIEMLKEWKARAEKDANVVCFPSVRAAYNGKVNGLQMAIDALSHFVEE